MALVSVKCPHYEIFCKDKETVPQNRKVAQTLLNIHLIVAGIEQRQKEIILKYSDLTNV